MSYIKNAYEDIIRKLEKQGMTREQALDYLEDMHEIELERWYEETRAKEDK